ncbi:SEC-C domain-containing protein [Pseudenhygromyxa sp. WMMC2535]|uniref:YchJ family protein n=1 Tax=Pseudenhygromyxa sp. WMMC2535 TaxID=2712867 RepID=UPI001553E971|nr:YchJ family metal-binding protein [Pseudenhygromyxa sp. WMMC2535]NVB38556.1 SEC-C domain-containing protein [Pseudenhygromyxa sp. WMMC2535]
MAISAGAACPCGSGRKYKRCCRPLHEGKAAKNPEALMRSRYSAYALGLVEYILATTHPDSPLAKRDKLVWVGEVASFCQGTRFEGLEVREASAEGARGMVAFFVRLSAQGRDTSFGERSVFFRVGGRWLYHSGELLESRDLR